MFKSKLIGSMDWTGAGGQKFLNFSDLPKSPKGKERGFKGAALVITGTLTSAAGGAGVLADLVAVLKHALDKATLRYVRDNVPLLFQNFSGEDLRRLVVFATEKGLKENIIGTDYAPGVATAFRIELPLLFFAPKYAARRKRLMCEEQFRSLKLEVQRAGTLVINADKTAAAAMSIVVKPMDAPCAYQAVVAPLSVRRDETAGNLMNRFDDGLTLAIIHDSVAQSANPLTRYQVDVAGRRIMEDAVPADVDDQTAEEKSIGAEVLDTDAAMLYQATKSLVEEDLPHGKPAVEQYANEIAAPVLRQYLYPVYTAEQIASFAASKSKEEARNVLVTADEAGSWNSADHGAMAITPGLLLTADDARFNLGRSGYLADSTGKVELHISNMVNRNAASITGLETGMRQSAALREQKMAIAQVPGQIATNGASRPGAVREGVRRAYAGYFG